MIKAWLRRLKEDERGLTLVELLAVVVVLGIVGSIAFVSIGNVIDNSKEDAHIANGLQVISAAELYEATGGTIPENAAEADPLKATELDTVGDLINPWDDETTYDFTVYKSDNDIVVAPYWGNDGEAEASGCSTWSTGKNKETLNDGRKVVCES